MLDQIYPYFEYASLLVAILYYNKFKEYRFYKYFLIYLLNIILVGVLEKNLEIFETSNKELYNVYTFFEFNFFSLIYYHLIKEKKYLKITLILLFNIIYFSSFYFLSITKYTASLEGFVNSIFIVLFFNELLNSNDVLNYKKLFPFWVSVGFLLFYLTTIPFFIMVDSRFFDSRTMYPILYSLIIVLHSCFIYGLVTCKKMNI